MRTAFFASLLSLVVLAREDVQRSPTQLRTTVAELPENLFDEFISAKYAAQNDLWLANQEVAMLEQYKDQASQPGFSNEIQLRQLAEVQAYLALAETDLATAEAAVIAQQASLEVLKALPFTSQADLDQAEADLNAAMQTLTIMQNNLKYWQETEVMFQEEVDNSTLATIEANLKIAQEKVDAAQKEYDEASAALAEYEDCVYDFSTEWVDGACVEKPTEAALNLLAQAKADCSAADGKRWSESEGVCVDATNSRFVQGLIFGFLGASAVGVIAHSILAKRKSDDDYKLTQSLI